MVGRRVPVGQQLTYDDSLSYIASVRKAFHDEPAKYDQFIKLLSDYSAQRINVAGLIARMEQLFKDHRKLLLGFSVFLPNSNIISPPQPNITIPSNSEERAAHGIYKRKHVESEGADFINKLKKRFQALDTHVVESFCEIMINFKEGNKSKSEVHKEVFNLLYYHEDLIDEFNSFLTNKSIL